MKNKNFKVIKIDHIAIASKDIKSSIKIFSDILGMTYGNIEMIENEKVNILKILNENEKTCIEIVEPSSKDSTVDNFIKKNGQGLHHIALEVDDIYNAIEYLKYKKIELIYDTPHIGSDNKLITFIHPKSSPGVLLELCQKND